MAAMLDNINLSDLTPMTQNAQTHRHAAQTHEEIAPWPGVPMGVYAKFHADWS